MEKINEKMIKSLIFFGHQNWAFLFFVFGASLFLKNERKWLLIPKLQVWMA